MCPASVPQPCNVSGMPSGAPPKGCAGRFSLPGDRDRLSWPACVRLPRVFRNRSQPVAMQPSPRPTLLRTPRAAWLPAGMPSPETPARRTLSGPEPHDPAPSFVSAPSRQTFDRSSQTFRNPACRSCAARCQIGCAQGGTLRAPERRSRVFRPAVVAWQGWRGVPQRGERRQGWPPGKAPCFRSRTGPGQPRRGTCGGTSARDSGDERP